MDNRGVVPPAKTLKRHSMAGSFSSMKTNIDTLEGTAPLYVQYGGQSQPQGAYVEIHADGSVYYESNGEIGNAVPVSVWHRRVLRITIPNDLTARGYEQLHDAIAEQLEAIIAGMDERWDGNNWVGTITDESREALERLGHQFYTGELDDFERAEEPPDTGAYTTDTGADTELADQFAGIDTVAMLAEIERRGVNLRAVADYCQG